KVVAAGKGTRYEPHYHASTPETVWDILDKYLRIEDRASINPKMFNSFIDGSKSAIEMTAVCNATGLSPQTGGLGFPPASGLELGISVASAALRGEPTGVPSAWRSDVVAVAKRALRAGEMLDGEGGFCVWGRQGPAEHSLAEGLLPLGLAHNVRLTRDVAA